jgi:hypothetical protein
MTSQRDIDNEKGVSEAVRLVLRGRILEQTEALTGGEKSLSTDDDSCAQHGLWLERCYNADKALTKVSARSIGKHSDHESLSKGNYP